jgi:predicted negative regulator of RcsB-dependent stress response
LDIYKSDDEQVETIRKWWDENGKSIITGIILGLAAIFGWRGWQDYRKQQMETASMLYQNVLQIIGTDTTRQGEMRVISDKILDDHGSSAYALLVKLIDARLAVDARDYSAAADHLRWALDHNHDESIGHVIRLRLARVLAAQENYDEALALLKAGDPGKFAASYAETEGDILKSKGDNEGARASYSQALEDRRAARLDTPVLELKLDDLGRAAE